VSDVSCALFISFLRKVIILIFITCDTQLGVEIMEEVLLHSFETPKRCKMEEEESFTNNHHTPCMLDGEDINSVASRNQHEASLKRGRPRAEVINHLIIEGTSSGSSIRCETCNRVFPREKSLQAHKRIHTVMKLVIYRIFLSRM